MIVNVNINNDYEINCLNDLVKLNMDGIKDNKTQIAKELGSQEINFSIKETNEEIKYPNDLKLYKVENNYQTRIDYYYESDKMTSIYYAQKINPYELISIKELYLPNMKLAGYYYDAEFKNTISMSDELQYETVSGKDYTNYLKVYLKTELPLTLEESLAKIDSKDSYLVQHKLIQEDGVFTFEKTPTAELVIYEQYNRGENFIYYDVATNKSYLFQLNFSKPIVVEGRIANFDFSTVDFVPTEVYNYFSYFPYMEMHHAIFEGEEFIIHEDGFLQVASFIDNTASIMSTRHSFIDEYQHQIDILISQAEPGTYDIFHAPHDEGRIKYAKMDVVVTLYSENNFGEFVTMRMPITFLDKTRFTYSGKPVEGFNNFIIHDSHNPDNPIDQEIFLRPTY